MLKFTAKFVLHQHLFCLGVVPEFLLKEPEYLLKGVPYREEDIYQLDQFHIHFGRHLREGSEHRIGWRAASGEVIWQS